MTYQEALQYLESFIDYEKLDSYEYNKSFKLERMRRLASLLGDPQKGIRSIHIAGSKGKGSTAEFVYSILKATGLRVGLYTSPHLVSFRERIKINDHLIDEEDMCAALEKIKGVMDKMNDDIPSFFEVYTLLAYLYFKEKAVDFAVYEVGLGGRLDATNIIEPLVEGITPISYEHTQRLGNTLTEIATEKAGIIKPNSICVSAPQEEEALNAIAKICKERDSRLIVTGRDILFEELSCDDNGEVFNVWGIFGEYPMLRARLLGTHQIDNAATAIGIVEALRFNGIIVGSDAIRNGIENAKWEGRLEVVRRNPYVVLDGAQNRASAKTLTKAIKKIFLYKRLILVLGVSKDKDLKGILEEVLPISDIVILTRSKVAERAAEPANIKELIKSKDDLTLTDSVDAALHGAFSRAMEEDLILVTGSLFLVGEARDLIVNQKKFLSKERLNV